MWSTNESQFTVLKRDYAIDVFDDAQMMEYLTAADYKALSALIKAGEHSLIDKQLANSVAEGMKTWATSRGATHYTHWFQPLTGITAEKHDSFIGKPDPRSRPLVQFAGDLLVRAEPDASSFPSGGLRTTFHARGYTVWDPMSPPFLLHYASGAVLYIPSAFLSWEPEKLGGRDSRPAAALDHKMPLLQSEVVLSKAAVEMLGYLGVTSTGISSTLGCEQEFFVVDRKLFLQRPDLLLTGRTLLGAAPSKGQELDDHYFGAIPRPVAALLQDIEMQLWRLGVPITTRHNEVAPAQHEFAPVYEATSVAVDHQMLMMNVMKAKARDHGFEILLHEKPFAGLNGSGKHNNWSIATSEGRNLLQPPVELLQYPNRCFASADNTLFTVFLAAVLKAVDDYQGQLRCSVANHGQDLRLGANEAPPAIISAYLGDALEGIVTAAMGEDGPCSPKALKSVQTFAGERLPCYERDQTDRNRTSPFAFTGNKFEFRAVGSTQNSAVPMTALNSAVSCALVDMNEAIKARVGKGMATQDAVVAVTRETVTKHQRIIYGGDNYESEWVVEAEKRGLQNWRTTPACFENVDMKKLYCRAGVMSETEVEARKVVALENYVKQKLIEFRSVCDLVQRHVFPSSQKTLARVGEGLQVAGSKRVQAEAAKLGELQETLLTKADELRGQVAAVEELGDLQKEANHVADVCDATMAELRAAADALEVLCAAEDWTLPTYHDLIFKQC